MNYIAIANEHLDTCRALNWARLSIQPMILAEGDDPEEVGVEGMTTGRRDDVSVIDTTTRTVCRWWQS